MKGNGEMQGMNTPGCGWSAWPIALAVALIVGVVPPGIATNTNCDGGEVDAGGYSCTSPALGDVVPDISGDPGVNVITSWKPKNCTGDDCHKLVPLGGDFDWYGSTYPEAYVGSNGYVSFGAGYTNEVSEDTIPGSQNPNNVVYAYGDDLDPSASGNVYYLTTTCSVDRDVDGTNDECFVVQWDALPHYNGAAFLQVTVQLALDFATDEAIVEIVSESGTAVAGHPRLLGTEDSVGSAGLWYKVGSDTDSRSATAGTQIIFTSDSTGPVVSGTNPGHGNVDVALDTTVRVIFNETMDEDSVTLTVLSGTDPGGFIPTWSKSKRVDFSHNGFSESEQVVLQVDGTDISGNPLTLNNRAGHPECDSGYCWFFDTVDLTAPEDVGKFTTASGDLTVGMDWSASPSSDVEGYLVLRRAGAEVNASPEDGTSYSVGDTVGVGNTVICSVTDGGSGAESCTDNTVSNGQSYYYKVFAYDTSTNYAGGVSREAMPRSAQSFKFAYTTASSTLAPVGIASETYIVGTGNDRLLHRMDAANGTWDGWIPPALGGAVQSRPKAGDLDLGGGVDYTAFVTAQNGYVYRFSLDDGTTSAEGSADAVTHAGCTSGLLQGGPAIMLEDIGSNGILGDEGVIVATRCGATDNKLLIYDIAIDGTEESSYGGGSGGLGISNSTPEILYMYETGRNNLVYAAVRDDGGESMIVIEVNNNGRFVTPPYAVVTGAGDIDTGPTFVRRGSDRDDWQVVIGNTAGELYSYDATARDGAAGSSLTAADSYTGATGDGPVKGIAVSTGVAVSPSYENWVIWTTSSTVHGIKIGTDGLFDESSYWSYSVAGASEPLVLRGVGGGTATRAYVGSSDGRLYEFDATTGALVSNPVVESGKTIGDPTFDYADGSNQGVVVGSSGGTFHWVVID